MVWFIVPRYTVHRITELNIPLNALLAFVKLEHFPPFVIGRLSDFKDNPTLDETKLG